MNKELFEALELLEAEKGIPVDFMLEKIEKAIVKACKNNYSGNDRVVINMDRDVGKFEVNLLKTVVEEVQNTGREISLLDARAIDPNAQEGDEVPVKLNTKDFGRIAAQTARNIIRQGIRDGEKDQVLKEFSERLHQVVTAVVEKIDPRSLAASIRIGKAEAVLPKNERIGNEKITEGDMIKVYIVDVKETEKGPKVIISRTHVDLVRRLFEQEVPEIADGTIKINSIAREAGSRTKIAVSSENKNVDAVGSCIGSHGNRIANIVKEINNEKIDIVEYDEDPVKFISLALAPARVEHIEVIDETIPSCVVSVPDEQLSLAIGNRGQNVRLAARLTGWKIDIKSRSQYEEWSQERESEVEEAFASEVEDQADESEE